FHEQLRDFFFSPEEITMHLEQADAVLREKANLFSVLEREQKKSVADIENLHDLYQAGQIDKYGFGRSITRGPNGSGSLMTRYPRCKRSSMSSRSPSSHRKRSSAKPVTLYTRWPTLPAEEKRQIVETITERIAIGDGDVEIHPYYAPAAAPPTTGTTGGR